MSVLRPQHWVSGQRSALPFGSRLTVGKLICDLRWSEL
jgi:hypothetical protein